MLYFNQEPYAPQKADEAEQWASVLKFRQRYSEQGLWLPYNGPSHFERLFHTNLTRLLMKRFAPTTPGGPSEEPITPDSHELQNRNDYISRYRDLIADSLEEIVLSTSKLHTSEARREAREINAALREARERGVNIRILVADGYDRLPGALELAGDLGIALRFDRRVHFSDVNYACVDKRAAIVAARTPSPPEADYRHSSSWVEFRSEALAAMLAEDFERQWRSPITRSVGQYLREILPAQISASSAVKDITRVAHHLAMPEELVKSYLKAKAPKIFLLGRPGSGKTTVARAIQDAVKSAGAPRAVKWVSDATYLWRVFRASGVGNESVEPTEDGGYFIKDATLYQKALQNLARRAKRAETRAALIILEFSRGNYVEALDLLAQKGVQPDLIVYLDVDFEIAIHRNRRRPTEGRGDRHYVSEREMRTTFLSDDLDQLKEKYKGRILVLAESAEPQEPEAVRGHAVQILERLKE